MFKFDPKHFPQYDKLTWFERFFLRTCCYFPPRPRRQRKLEDALLVERFRGVYERAFGSKLWSLIKGKRVLDLGCGEGGYVLALATEWAACVVGIDIQADFLYARKAAASMGIGNVFFIQGPIESLQDECFDVVISHDSFEHFSEPEAMLSEMVRVTRVGGHILIKFGPPWCNPWGRHMSGRIRKDRPWIHLIVPERIIMRCWSVYHNEPVLLERFDQLPGGLNKMTIARFKKILQRQANIKVESFEVLPLFSLKFLTTLPIIQEFFASSVKAQLVRIS